MSAATIVAQAFGEGACLYTTVLGLPSSGEDITPAQLRKAYYKRALLYHPDKQSGKGNNKDELDDAKSKFQAVSVAYSILSNPETRAEYDETGELNDESDGDDDGGTNEKSGTDAWKEYFSGIFGKVTTNDIDKFEAKYKCSEEEESDVLKYYKSFRGDLDKMLECVMLSRDIDKKRWVEDYIEPAIKRGDVVRYGEAMRRTLGGDVESDDDDDENMEEVEDGDETESDETETEEEEDDDDDNDTKKKRSQPRGGKKGSQGTTKKKAKPPPKKKKESTKHKQKKTAKVEGRESGGRRANKKAASAMTNGNNKGGPSQDLIAAIRGNASARAGGRSFDSMMAGIEERYCGRGGGGKKKGGGGKKKGGGKSKHASTIEEGDIPDDEFERIQARMEARRKKGKSK